MAPTTVREDGVAGSAMVAAQPEVSPDWPLENPVVYSRPDDPLCEPHPDEPGVCSDGSAAPLENPEGF